MKDNEKRKKMVKNIGKMSIEREKVRERERVVYICIFVYNV